MGLAADQTIGFAVAVLSDSQRRGIECYFDLCDFIQMHSSLRRVFSSGRNLSDRLPARFLDGTDSVELLVNEVRHSCWLDRDNTRVNAYRILVRNLEQEASTGTRLVPLIGGRDRKARVMPMRTPRPQRFPEYECCVLKPRHIPMAKPVPLDCRLPASDGYFFTKMSFSADDWKQVTGSKHEITFRSQATCYVCDEPSLPGHRYCREHARNAR